jgi:CBS-domain-containing membrane protein
MIFAPLLAGATLRERLVALLGATIGIALTIIVCTRLSPGAADLPVIVAPLGASAVLVFAVPASPLAQPWPVIGGNVISTLIGVTAFHLIGAPVIAAGVAVGGAILVMSLCRCLHPPGGAAALTAVIGSQGIHDAGYGFAFAPVALNSLVLVAVAMAFHRAMGRSYPHRPAPPPPAIATPSRFDASDLDAALADMHDSFDVARADLEVLLAHAERHAATRTARS